MLALMIILAAQLPAPQPFKPDIQDPMLAPVARPETELKTWDEALDMARRNSTDERSAEAAIARAHGRWRQSLGALLPNARASASLAFDLLNPDRAPLAGASDPNATSPLGSATAGLTQSVIDVSAWHGLDSSEASQQGAESSLSDVRRRLTLGLSRTLVAVVTAERIAELNRLGLQQALERAALTARTAELGAATQVDVVRVEQDVEVARGILIAGDEQLLRTREALGIAVGVPREVGVVRGFVLDGLLRETEQVCKKVSWEERPDVEAARQNVESASATRRQASAGYLPTLGVTSNFLAYTVDPGGVRAATWSIGAVLSVPIWEGGTREGLVEERRGAETQAAQTLETARRTAALEATRAQRGVGVAEALVQSAAKAREKAAQLDTLTRKSFEAGRGSSIELVQSAQVLRQADVSLAARELELVQARLDAILTEASCAW